jgi:cellulase (glycosyl hydrolase family 5)
MSISQELTLPTPSGQRITVTINSQIMVGDIKPGLENNWAKLHGANFVTGVLGKKETNNDPNGSPGDITSIDIPKFMSICRDNRWNIVRVPVYMEAYESNKTRFLDELDLVVSSADDNGIQVLIDNHQFEVSSKWKYGGRGFPGRLVSGYVPTEAKYNDSVIAAKFWKDLYLNQVAGVPDIWDEMIGFFEVMINRVKDYPNVLGWEILNEPQAGRDEDYTEMGKMNTQIGQFINSADSNAKVFFCRDNGIGPYGGRKENLEHLMAPRCQNVVYDPHCYNLSSLESKHVPAIRKVMTAAGISQCILGEWANQPDFDPTNTVSLANCKTFLNVFKREGWASTYWAMGPRGGIGNKLCQSSGALNPEGVNLKQGIAEVYV